MGIKPDTSLTDVLKDYFGFSAFKGNQELVIRNILVKLACELRQIDIPVPSVFHDWSVSTDDAARLYEKGGLQEATAVVTLVSASPFIAAIWTFAFNKAIRQKTLIMLAVKHLCILAENIAILVDLHQCLSHELLMHWAFSSRVIIKGGTPPAKEFSYYGMVPVCKLLRRYPLL